MEYKTDKRTKNLTLRDIHVGDWVQVWSEQTERYSPPLKITQICDDGTVYLIIDEENRLDPWEENIKDIDALPIDADLLRGFGIETKKDVLGNYELYHNGEKLTGRYLDKNFKGERFISDADFNRCYFFHEFIDSIPNNIKVEWKGV